MDRSGARRGRACVLPGSRRASWTVIACRATRARPRAGSRRAGAAAGRRSRAVAARACAGEGAADALRAGERGPSRPRRGLVLDGGRRGSVVRAAARERGGAVGEVRGAGGLPEESQRRAALDRELINDRFQHNGRMAEIGWLPAPPLIGAGVGEAAVQATTELRLRRA